MLKPAQVNIANYNGDIHGDNAIRCEATYMDANEVLRRYKDGERNFRLQDLKDLSFIQENLSGIDFTGSNLSRTNLSGSDLSDANLNWSTLKGADLSGVNFKGAKMPDGKIYNDRLKSANYFGT